MAEQRRDQRTEQPTQKRRRKLRRDGRVARSQDIGSAVALVGLAATLRFLLPPMGSAMMSMSHDVLSSLSNGPDGELLRSIVVPATIAVLVPPMVISLGLALVAGFGQTGFALSPGALKPKWSRISPRQGAEKFKPTALLFESLRTILKIGALVAVLWIPLAGVTDRAPGTSSLGEWVSYSRDSMWTVLLWSTALAAVIAAIDYGYNRRKLIVDSRMTRQEVRDEQKDTDGDPLLRGARRARARELSRNRMLSEVGSADVLLVNPIRFAVALTYVESEGAPRVVARGAGKFALKLRQEAYRHGVPVRQDVPLTRALYRRCRVGQFVPAELYEAVAVVLAAVYRRRAARRRIAA